MILQNAQARKILPQKYQDNIWHRLTFVAKYLIKKNEECFRANSHSRVYIDPCSMQLKRVCQNELQICEENLLFQFCLVIHQPILPR